MNSIIRGIVLFSFFLYGTISSAQQDPFFMPFEGDVYKLPAKKVMDSKFGYSKEIFDYPKIGKISWQEIKVKKSTTDYPFPDVDMKDRFGMVLDSEMIIKQDGCYEFELSSDDGSIFWIDLKKIIDNDHTHKMTTVKDTVLLKKRKYPIKLWYYQGFVNQYGFVFDGRYIGQDCPEAKELSSIETPEGSVQHKKNLTLNSSHLFDYDSFTLKKDVLKTLDSLVLELRASSISKITIHGYTCDRGTESYNLNLSQKRADQLQAFFLEHLKKPGIIFRSIGHGSKEPIASNDTDQSRQLNRRVEIVIE